jgi:hypothetical protein
MMVKTVREFIDYNVKKGYVKRDLFIGDDIDKTYLAPLVKAWGEYGIGKRDIIFLSILIAHKYEKQIKKNEVLKVKNVEKSGKPVDMGRLTDFSDAEITFLVSILISKYGTSDVVNKIGEIWGDLRVMAERGIKILYTKVYKEKMINTEIFNTILNLDEELKI